MESLKTATNNQPIYNSRLINSLVKLIKREYNYININELLRYAKMEPYQVEDEGHWFSQEQADLFYEKLVKFTGNNNLAREAGRYAAARESSGLLRSYILGHIGPTKVYEMIGKYAYNFTKSSYYKSKRLGSNKVEITVKPFNGVCEKPYQCENRIGYFEAISSLFNYRFPKIEHPECMFKGGKVCRYIVSWSKSRYAFWNRLRNYAALFLSTLCVGSYLVSPQVSVIILFPFSVLIVLLLTFFAGTLEKQELNAAMNNLRESTDQLLERINMNYNNALMINEIGIALSKHMDIDGILTRVTQILEKWLDYDRGMILLANEDKTRLAFRAGFGYTAEQLSILKSNYFHLDRPESKGVFAVSFREQKPFLINNLDEIADKLTPRSLEFAKKMGAKSFICCPIIYEAETLGILAVDNIKTKRPLLQSDINLLMGITPEIGISIHNSMLIEARERQFKSIIQVLAASIDARDPMTAGHSEKVTEYVMGICCELGLSKEYCEMMRVAALLHDYGKIGIRDSLLMKNGQLSIEEREEIKSHVEKTRRILEQINFEGIYNEVPEIISCHHEKMDGSGYPRSLKGEEIPLGAKILAVADFFEAITSKRHYREPMLIDVAFEHLKGKSGIHFDCKVVEAFINYFVKEYNIKPKQLV